MNTTPLLTLLIAAASISLPLHAQTPAGTPAPAASPDEYSSAGMVGKAWAAKTAGNDADVVTITTKCIETFGPQAVAMQKSLTAPVPTTDKEKVFSMWALNDVGTAYFLKGQSLEKLGKTKEAVEAYKFLADNLAYAQCWDPNGWFWRPAGAAAERVQALQFDAVK